ncbi:M24 family metallopeptidase [Halobaculum sp. MBLA0147]|uniref:M24 family metallopeptidase n=1 Tax=Halobaculum sp. MBLA0147 TaxID=3079934 RepID=UPI003523374F
MTRQFTAVDEALAAADADGYLVNAGGDDATQRYLSGFDAPDPFFTVYTPDGLHLLVSGLEYGRAKTAADADHVARYADYDRQQLIEQHGERTGTAKLVAAFLADAGVESVLAPDRFPLGIADALRDVGVDVTVDDDDAVGDLRAVKTDEEVEWIREAQAANETAMAAAEELLRAATVEDGTLYHDGEPLTSERVRREIEVTLLRHGCALDETIVACGADAADPHERGSGPLTADDTIVVDIFPRDKETRYHGDMTRTFVVGEPSDEVRRRYELTHEAMEAALDAVAAGVTGSEVHGAACDVYEDAGYTTFRTDPSTETGFIHSTGHGLGLEVHEAPSVSPRGEELEAGNVITIEPGLYDPAVGGVRIEDTVVVTEDGYRNLTDYPIELVVD